MSHSSRAGNAVILQKSVNRQRPADRRRWNSALGAVPRPRSATKTAANTTLHARA